MNRRKEKRSEKKSMKLKTGKKEEINETKSWSSKKFNKTDELLGR